MESIPSSNDVEEMIQQMRREIGDEEKAQEMMDESGTTDKESNFGEQSEDGIRYQHPHVHLEEVVNNIDEYIIPECQGACKCF